MYQIKITYSWGDEEDPDQYGRFPTKEAAYQKACELAGREAYIQNEEFLPERDNCIVTFNASQYAINLYYTYDDSYCHYRIIEN